MTTISGFTFIHNAISSGYPIVEAIKAVYPYVDEMVVVDMQSTDGTREVLQRLGVRILDGQWGNQAGETLKAAHSKYIECSGDVIIHFEADEVYEDRLIRSILNLIEQGSENLSVYRLQIELNFQRCRWYPEAVHRVFRRDSEIVKDGHTTNFKDSVIIPVEYGYLWDITNCFRDNWMNRVAKQAQMRQGKPQYLMTPIHTLQQAIITEAEAQQNIYGAGFWLWKETPFAIPEILRPLVGVTKYEAKI
jgi:glycosyltransferase involved in cell wall biosynthesis